MRDLGASVEITVRCGEQQVLAVTTPRARGIEIGDPVAVELPATACVVLPLSGRPVPAVRNCTAGAAPRRRRPGTAAPAPAADLPGVMLGVFFVVLFGIMLAVSFFHRVEGAFYEPAFELANYARFLSPFFGKALAFSV